MDKQIQTYIKEILQIESELYISEKFLFSLLTLLEHNKNIHSNQIIELSKIYIQNNIIPQIIYDLVYEQLCSNEKLLKREEIFKILVSFYYFNTCKYWDSILYYFKNYIEKLYSLLSLEKIFDNMWLQLVIKASKKWMLWYYECWDFYFLDSVEKDITLGSDGFIDFTGSFIKLKSKIPQIMNYIWEESLICLTLESLQNKYETYIEREIKRRRDEQKRLNSFNKIFWIMSKSQKLISIDDLEKSIKIYIFYQYFICKQSYKTIDNKIKSILKNTLIYF